ncbi:hypothetical protein LCGC14_1042060 [marine sediment metagenome]|uniref:SMP-30/Gluconolactonase/LRE-like region domain-containing protein n=1 Tax=marine sediment metagenome TaxID=412755 RepID=A0A0F9MRE1_9ZZZZ
MKRLFLSVFLSLIIIFALISGAYLLRPTNININIDKLQNVKSEQRVLLIQGSWGKDKGQFGIDESGWLPGPMSLASDANDNVFLLDQLNSRVQIFSDRGQLIDVLKIDNTTYEDIAIDDDGFIYLLDPVENRLVRKFNRHGKIIRTYRIASEVQPISGLLLSDNKVYVEVAHKKLYSVGTNLKASRTSDQKKPELTGRPGEDFTTEAEINSNGEVNAEIKGHYPIDAIKITGSANVYSIISINSDNDENLYITLNTAKTDAQFDQNKDRLLGLVIGPDGLVNKKFSASNDYYTSHFRKITVSSNGTIFQMQTTKKGVLVWRW